jgi:2-aminoadipate transaminase
MIPLPRLDAKLDEPLYRQLFAHFRDEILAGRLAQGTRIPPTRELAGQLGLNRMTVSSAYELLESAGLIRSHVGRGSFVAATVVPKAFDWEERLSAQAGSVDTKIATGDAPISFATARPSETLFPLEAFRESCREVLESPEAASILQLGSPQGYGPLRRYLMERGRAAGTLREHDDLLITNGCQQAFDLLQRLLIRPGESVLVEDPIYPGLRNVFVRAGARLLGVPVTSTGMDLEQVARLLRTERVRLIVATPNFQNPTGVTMPAAERNELLRLAREAQIPIIENDIYGELRYVGAELPTLKQLDDSGVVIQVKSFSKIAFPGLRVGWVTAPRALVRRLTEWKQVTDLHTDHLSQAVLLRFAVSGRLEAHRQRMLESGRERLEAVLAGCARYLPEGTRFTRPEGGMNLWVRLPEPLDAAALLAQAQQLGVEYLPAPVFEVNMRQPGGLRLSFAGLPTEQIERGLAVLGRIFSVALEEARSERMEPAQAIV